MTNLPFEVIHATPGRVRVALPGLNSNSHLAERLQHALTQQAGVNSVKWHKYSHSLLINYDPLCWPDGFPLTVLNGKPTLPDVPERVIQPYICQRVDKIYDGRLRLKLPVLKSQPELMAPLEKFLQRQPGITHFSLNQASQRVLIIYDPEKWSGETLVQLIAGFNPYRLTAFQRPRTWPEGEGQTRGVSPVLIWQPLAAALLLPFMPNQALGPPPFDIINPFDIWLFVVIFSGVSSLGYMLLKQLGPRSGIGATGFLGGTVSSMATTLGLAELSQKNPQLVDALAAGILLAWLATFGSILVTVATLNPSLALAVGWAVAAMALAGLLAVWRLQQARQDGDELESQSIQFKPFGLGRAMGFGLLFVAALFFARAVQLLAGDGGIYLSSFLTGIASEGAMALSMAELSNSGAAALNVAASGLMLGLLADVLSKVGLAAWKGTPALRRRLLPGTTSILGVGLVAVLLL